MLSCIHLFADLPTPKRQKMREPAEPRTGKSSEKWVKSSDMSQIPSGRTSRGDYGYWKSRHFKAGAVNITINFPI